MVKNKISAQFILPTSNEELSNLLAEFKSLKTIEKKLKFWKLRFGQEYIFFLFLTTRYNFSRTPEESEVIFILREFYIKPTRAEIKKYNTYLFEQYKSHSKKSAIETEVLSFNEEIEAFDKKYKAAANKDGFVNRFYREKESLLHFQQSILKSNPTDYRPKYFLKGFEDQYVDNKEPDLYFEKYDYLHLISLMNGSTLAKIFKHLDEFATNSTEKAQLKASKKVFSIKQQLIALHYLGVIDKIATVDNAANEAIFLSSLLGKSSQNIRKELGKYGSLVKRKPSSKGLVINKDLELVQTAFQNLGLEDIVAKIEDDFKTLKIRKLK